MKKFTIISAAFLAFSLTTYSQVTQLGSTVIGNTGDHTGRSVAISEDGLTLAIGEKAWQGSQGRVRLFKFENGDWVPKGATIAGLSGEDYLAGADVDLSADGNTLMLGAPQAEGAFYSNVGGSAIFEYNSSNDTWEPKGGYISPTVPFLQSHSYAGREVAMSNGGDVAYFAAYVSDGNPADNTSEVGVVYARYWTGTSWNEMGGGEIIGANDNDWFGYSIDASNNVLAVGIPQNNITGATGEVKVYNFSSNTWSLKGSAISGPVSGAAFGSGVEISADGNRMVVGANKANITGVGAEAGYAACYEFDGTDWQMMGSPFYGLNEDDGLGLDPSMNAAGDLIAIGARRNDSAGVDAGMVTVYHWDGTDWVQVGDAIFGSSANEQFGFETSLDGNILAVGGLSTGYVKTYEIEVDSSGDPVGLSEIKLKKMAVYPNPASDMLNFTSHNVMKEIKIYDNSGRLVLTKNTLSSFQNQLDISSLTAGAYIVNVTLENGELISEKVLLK